MSQVLLPDTLASEIACLKARLSALEGHSPQVQTVQDATGRVRFIFGKLDMLGGAYIGTIGSATLDASGNVINDTLGLRAVVPNIGSLAFSVQSGLAFTTTWTGISATNTAFTIAPRAQDVLVFGTAAFDTSGGTANYAYMRLALVRGPIPLRSSTPTTRQASSATPPPTSACPPWLSVRTPSSTNTR